MISAALPGCQGQKSDLILPGCLGQKSDLILSSIVVLRGLFNFRLGVRASAAPAPETITTIHS